MICGVLGIRTTALKGDGFTAYLPDMTTFVSVVDQIDETPQAVTNTEWLFHVSGSDIAAQMLEAGAQIATEAALNYTFISLRAS
ncbi:hypothetical protein D3C84_876700 [compost metagenome]